jgi:hypothetical protein
MTEGDVDRFWSKVQIGDTGECWPWRAARDSGGYGNFKRSGKACLAHRLAFFLHKGFLPEGLCILHDCDFRACCNPFHLKAGTKQDNAVDMVRKGRHRGSAHPGERHHNAKLTDEQVLTIRQSPERRGVLAKRYGVSRGLISGIRTGRCRQTTV